MKKEEQTLYDLYGKNVTIGLLFFELGFMFAIFVINYVPKLNNKTN